MDKEVIPALKSRKVKQILLISAGFVTLAILFAVGYFAYQIFVLKSEVGGKLLLMTLSKAQSFLIPSVILVLVLAVAAFAYINLNRQSLSFLAKKRILLSALVVILAITTIVGGYFSYQYYLVKKEFGPQLAAQQETRKVVAAVGKLMLLPNETPTIATVTDITKLKDQQFFSKAKNGDKILIYANAKEAILYSPSLNIILGVAPVTIGGGQAPSQATQARIALRNGTDSPGLTYKVEGDIQKAFPGANIVLKDQAQNTQYLKTIVISLNDIAKVASQDLARKLNATVSTLPQGEPTPPGVDILVIVGKDRL